MPDPTPRTPPSRLKHIAAHLALTSFVPEPDYARFSSEDIVLLHENVKLRVRLVGPLTNRFRINRGSIVLTSHSLAVYERLTPLVRISTDDLTSSTITATVDADNRLELVIPRGVGQTKWSDRGDFNLRLKIPNAKHAADAIQRLLGTSSNP